MNAEKKFFRKGFKNIERPGAVYLASVLASHAQKGLPAFGIYGHDVQNMDDTSIPKDVEEKILRFARAAVAVATMRGKSYLQIGSICMGIAGSIINPEFFEEYLGMRVESVDEVEIIRRMTEGIYDKEEFEKALAWTKANCPEGFDKNPEFVCESDEKKEESWEFVVKMMCIIKDLFNGNKNLPFGVLGKVDLRCLARNSLEEKPEIQVKSDVDFTLKVKWCDKLETIYVKANDNKF